MTDNSAQSLGPKDEQFQSRLVYGLRHCNFKPFLGNNAVVMVMFYDPTNIKQRVFFSKAASETCRAGHAYAAVNCSVDRELCIAEGACNPPMYKLYEQARVKGTLREVCDYNQLKKMVEGKSNSNPCAAKVTC